jgi:hypothetical protein
LVVGNVLLLAGSKAWGRAVLDAPASLEKGHATDAVCHLVDQHARLVAVVPTLDGRPSSDPVVLAHRWELLANEVVTLTLGASLLPQAYPAAVSCWRSIWLARREGPEAVRAMLAYAKAYSVDCVPLVDGKAASPDLLLKLSATLPPMFRPKAAGKAK